MQGVLPSDTNDEESKGDNNHVT